MHLLSADPDQACKVMQNKLIFFFKRRDPLYLKVPILVPFSLMYVRFSIWRPSIISHVKTCGRALSSAYFHNYDLRRKWRVEEIISSAPWSKSEQGCSCLKIWNEQVSGGLSMILPLQQNEPHVHLTSMQFVFLPVRWLCDISSC